MEYVVSNSFGGFITPTTRQPLTESTEGHDFNGWDWYYVPDALDPETVESLDDASIFLNSEYAPFMGCGPDRSSIHTRRRCSCCDTRSHQQKLDCEL